MGRGFSASYASTHELPLDGKFFLHLHDNYEIYLFLDGDCKYVVEENVYPLSPGDVIVIKKNQLHRVFHNAPSRYTRIVFNISPSFFAENGCSEYEKKFVAPQEQSGNRIAAETVKESGLYEAIMRVRKYTDDFQNCDTPVAKAAMIEVLYLINSIELKKKTTALQGHMREIIEYLNVNFKEDVTLDDLEKRFFISKYHICHVFPELTGLTVHQYITKKRLAYAKELIESGKSAGFASDVAGFHHYSSFYRSFVSEYGVAPSVKKRG